MTVEEERALARLGENLRLRRVVRNLSQETIAFRAEIHRTQISLIEHGQRSMMLLTFVKLCGALGVPPDDLLEGIAWEPGRFGDGSFLTGDDRPGMP